MRFIKLGADKIYVGSDAIRAVAELPGDKHRAYIVMSGTIQQELGQLKVLTGLLEEAGWSWRANTDVEPEPTWPSIQRGVADMVEFEPDWVIGFGGGSAMDAAKAMWVFYENPQYKTLDEVMPPAPLSLRKRAKICCIATSAGTGSECTRAALIKDPQQHKKYSIRDYSGLLIPDVAILDASFATTMPLGGTAACGMDALTHAIESYVSNQANAFSDAQAVGAWLLGRKALRACAKDLSDGRAREDMLVSSCLAGIAFTNSALGICHGVAHTFGAMYNIPHGLANGIVLPYAIDTNARNSKPVSEKYAELARLAGVADLHDEVVSLRKELGVPSSVSEVMTDRARFEEDLNALVELVLADVCTPANPVEVNAEIARHLLTQSYYG